MPAVTLRENADPEATRHTSAGGTSNRNLQIPGKRASPSLGLFPLRTSVGTAPIAGPAGKLARTIAEAAAPPSAPRPTQACRVLRRPCQQLAHDRPPPARGPPYPPLRPPGSAGARALDPRRATTGPTRVKL